MADTPKTPTPPRRKAATGARKTTRATPPKTAKVPAAEDGAAKPATKTAAKVTAPRKPAARKPAAPKPTTATRARTAAKSAASKVGSTAGTAAHKVADRASSAANSVAQSTPVQLVADTRERMGDRNFFAALIGGVAALGAAVGGIFYALRDGKAQRSDDDAPKA